MSELNYLEINRALWNAKTPHHLQSEFYAHSDFINGRNSLNDIELALLGDVRGKKVLHLQCHFGQDTLSLARMGAEVTGIDLSPEAIDTAKALAAELGLDARFILTDIYKLPELLNEEFDIVFTSYGTICWLPDLAKWAGIVSKYMASDGMFVFADFHPAVWMFDNDFTHVAYSYFNREPIVETESGTYAEQGADINLQSVTWNHSIGEVLGSLLARGLQLNHFEEYDQSPYGCFNKNTEVAPGRFQIPGMEGKLPLVYSLKMTK